MVLLTDEKGGFIGRVRNENVPQMGRKRRGEERGKLDGWSGFESSV